MKRPPRNVAASHRAKLLALSWGRGEDFQFLLGQWIIERFLFRLAASRHKNSFVLKGAMRQVPPPTVTERLVWVNVPLKPSRRCQNRKWIVVHSQASRKFVPSPPVKHTPGSAFEGAAPLLEEEWHTGL